jgi:hypothetical protein
MDYVEEVALEAAGFTSLEEEAAAADGDKKPAASEDTVPDTAQEDETTCVVCLDAHPTHTLAPCGHRCVCDACSQMLSGKPCPICRVTVMCVVAQVFG